MIEWVKVGDRKPDNSNELWEGQPCTPYVPCIVWVCNPSFLHGGVFESVRWDVKNDNWMTSDLGKWIHEYPYEITHFSDKINKPLIIHEREN